MVLLMSTNDLKNFNSNHVTKITYYPKGQAIIKHNQINTKLTNF